MDKPKEIQLLDEHGRAAKEFKIGFFNPEEGMDLWLELSHVAGKPFGELLNALNVLSIQNLSGFLNSQVDGAGAGQAIEDLASKIIKAGGVRFMKRFFTCVQMKSKDTANQGWVSFTPAEVSGSDYWTFNAAFQGCRIGDAMGLFMAVCVHNFRNLRSGLLATQFRAAMDRGKEEIEKAQNPAQDSEG